ncbi:hypothetical protein Dda_3252 [Drechslerella dactyloides]|uniref:Uncharacterized protein n=1 Tax=Drechslerella dactyloides TaxID=74499 RepID=A0AAD6J2K1_DREDA|nr:hypothetical protein Dda_3252 [Drechslerella dactyloides]
MPCKPQVWPKLDWFQGKFENAAIEEKNERIHSLALQIIKEQNNAENGRMSRTSRTGSNMNR